MCELARNSIMQSGWGLQIKKQWLGDDLETVQSTNVPAGRLAFRREVLAEEKRLMMLSARRSRANTAISWNDASRPVSSRGIAGNGVASAVVGTGLGAFPGDQGKLDNLDERSDENEDVR